MSTHYLFAAQAQGGSSSLPFLLMMVVMFSIFYFILILPQQRRQKKWQQMLGELKAGDKVVTSGGLHGTIIALKDEYLHLRVPPDNLRLEVTRGSIVSVSNGEGKSKAA